MPDMTMCRGGECPHKSNCYRHKARPDFQQSWFDEPPCKEPDWEFFIKFHVKPLIEKENKNGK